MTVKQILRYLKGTQGFELIYRKAADNFLTGYSDADFAGDLNSHHSMTGYMFTLSDGAISWFSKKQSMVVLSTVNAEYVALSSAVQEVIWLR